MKTYGQYVAEDYDTFGSPFGSSGASAPTANPATDKQIGFIVRLAEQHSADLDSILNGREWSEVTKIEASAIIDTFLNMPKPPTTPKHKIEIEDGMYRVSLDGGPEMTIYKVQHAVHGSGHQYAKKLVFEDGSWIFKYASGVVFKLRPEHKMTLEDAKAFGALYGTCCVCGRTLTDEKSIEAGIGPICAGKF